MPAIDFSVRLDDPLLADFLADVASKNSQFVQTASQPTGFKEAHRRKNESDTGTLDATFLIRELYRLKLKTVPQGTVAADVFLEQTLSIWVEYVLYLKDGLAADIVARAQRLVDEYNASNSPDLSAWISEQIKDGWIADSDLQLLADIHVEKVGKHREVNIAQRLALFRLYGIDPSPISTSIGILPETSFPRWATERNAELELIGTEATRRNQPQVGREVAELKPGTPPGSNAQTQVASLLDEVTRNILPSECRGDFRREQQRLVSVFAWPEFKLEWYTITIKIGCARIQISLPRLLVRISNLIIFIYYHVPKRFDEAILTILKNCAIRSALSGAVIGIVVGNPAAAIAAFQSFFVDCLRQDAFACINPGLFLAKEVGDWT